MRGRILLFVGLAIGYVLGTRRGREGYAELKDRAQALWRSPRVNRAVDAAKDTVKKQAPGVSAKVEEAVTTTKAVAEDIQSSDA